MAALFQFVMRSGPTPGAVYPLEGDQLIIGRDAVNGVAINDAEVSRKHARMTFQGGKYVLEDLGSTNGTFVNGQRLVSSTVLKPGDVVSFGEQIVLMYEGLSADAGATVIGRKAPRPAPAPAAAPPAPQYYAPPPAVPAAAGPPSKNLPIFIGIGVVAVICLCAAALWYIDSNYMWCTFFPFLSGCG
jgi:predicted component of type VI protein secretion system